MTFNTEYNQGMKPQHATQILFVQFINRKKSNLFLMKFLLILFILCIATNSKVGVGYRFIFFLFFFLFTKFVATVVV